MSSETPSVPLEISDEAIQLASVAYDDYMAGGCEPGATLEGTLLRAAAPLIVADAATGSVTHELRAVAQLVRDELSAETAGDEYGRGWNNALRSVANDLVSLAEDYEQDGYPPKMLRARGRGLRGGLDRRRGQ